MFFCIFFIYLLWVYYLLYWIYIVFVDDNEKLYLFNIVMKVLVKNVIFKGIVKSVSIIYRELKIIKKGRFGVFEGF